MDENVLHATDADHPGIGNNYYVSVIIVVFLNKLKDQITSITSINFIKMR